MFADTSLPRAATEDVDDHDGHDHGDTDVTIDPDAVEVSCPAYCELLGTICDADFFPYSGQEECLLTCTRTQWPLATLEDVSGNSVGCRMYHTIVAETEGRAIHCPHAGPSGGDVCGGWCVNYCDLFMSVCNGEVDEPFDSTDACLRACVLVNDGGIDAIPNVTGDTIQCRINAAIRASASPPVSAIQHCPAARVATAEVCVEEPVR